MNDKKNTRTSGVRQSDSFTRNQFDWLRQVAVDSDLRPASSRVAISLTRYFSREHDGWAWMKQVTLANELNISERAVRDALDDLVAGSHLIREQRGKMQTNRYRLALTVSDRQESADHKPSDRQGFADHSAEVTGKFTSSDRQESAGMTGKNLPIHMNPLIEPTEEPTEERGAPQARPRQTPSALNQTPSALKESSSNNNHLSLRDLEARVGALGAPAAPKASLQVPHRSMITMSNVVPFRAPLEEIEPDHEPGHEADAYAEIGYRRRQSPVPRATPAPQSETMDWWEGDLSPIGPRPPGWKPGDGIDEEELGELPF